MTQQNIEIREAISAGEQLLYQLEQSRAQLKKHQTGDFLICLVVGCL